MTIGNHSPINIRFKDSLIETEEQQEEAKYIRIRLYSSDIIYYNANERKYNLSYINLAKASDQSIKDEVIYLILIKEKLAFDNSNVFKVVSFKYKDETLKLTFISNNTS